MTFFEALSATLIDSCSELIPNGFIRSGSWLTYRHGFNQDPTHFACDIEGTNLTNHFPARLFIQVNHFKFRRTASVNANLTSGCCGCSGGIVGLHRALNTLWTTNDQATRQLSEFIFRYSFIVELMCLNQIPNIHGAAINLGTETMYPFLFGTHPRLGAVSAAKNLNHAALQHIKHHLTINCLGDIFIPRYFGRSDGSSLCLFDLCRILQIRHTDLGFSHNL